jgi:DNA-binding transcriptional MerR regulator
MRPLPEKKYFKIGEVADLVGVEPHVLRYWETQFPQVRPHKARSGHRLYRRREVETLLVIRELLHVQRFTIAGARQALRQPGGAAALLPRFFDGTAPLSAQPAESAAVGDDAGDDEIIDDIDGVTLPPTPVDTLPDEVEIEAVGLSAESLSDALHREAAEQEAERYQGRAQIAEVEVEAEPARVQRPAASIVFAPRRRIGAAQRALLEDALEDARAIMALLDREDAREPRRLHA